MSIRERVEQLRELNVKLSKAMDQYELELSEFILKQSNDSATRLDLAMAEVKSIQAEIFRNIV